MRNLVTRSTQVLFDLLVLSAALFVAFLVRFEGELPLQMLKRLLFLWPYVVAFEYAVLVAFGVPKFAWSYFGLRETTRVLGATAAASAVLAVVRLVAASLLDQFGYAQYAVIPLGVLVANLAAAFLGVAGIRVLRRLQVEQQQSQRRRSPSTAMVRTMLVGAGQAGLMVAKEIATRPDLGIDPIGFIDDDPSKLGKVVHGLQVLGTSADLVRLCRQHEAKQGLVTIANAPGKDLRRIKALCDEAGITAKIIPGIYEIVGGQVNLSRIRGLSIEDLLRREAVVLETESISEAIRGRVVLVTGAGGSIGAELCRQICRFSPSALVLVEQAENNLFHIHRELVASFPALSTAITPCVADICDAARVDSVFRAHRPSIVFHAAAHKHVPMMEWNPGEAVKNNVFGTRTLADASHAHGVGQFVMISTDKAVNPTSVMGVSKRCAEVYIQSLSQSSETRFVTVRFGNVLGSAGSVIPLFQEQIARGGPVMVTHPEMKRYFMTIPEACQLVLQAGSMGKGGEIFVLDMGEPVKIVDLARDLITLSGLRVGEDIEIEFSGIRPGEKLFEELSVAGEQLDKTRHPKIFVGRFRPHELEAVKQALAELRTLADSGGADQIREKFRQIVPEYTPDAGSSTTARQETLEARPTVAQVTVPST
ncbi:MAG: nucleoside-diphosphate sugar epimerase/dehydratase [Myxococcales bacterium]|nr:nucleoside-diphosphate sugar epimerase/dehydratase [Myxococcales bacterium]